MTESTCQDKAFDKALLSRARYVLRNSPMVEGERYPRRCLDVMNGLISLTEAYELAQQDFKDREKKEREAKEIAAKRADLEARYPDLAALVAEDRLSLSKAIAAAEQADREAAEEAARMRELPRQSSLPTSIQFLPWIAAEFEMERQTGVERAVVLPAAI